jgi:hypothetical protein
MGNIVNEFDGIGTFKHLLSWKAGGAAKFLEMAGLPAGGIRF